MSTNKYIDRVCIAILIFALVITAVFCYAGGRLGIQVSARVQEYTLKLFDPEIVHTIDIVMDDWDGFLDTCENEEYAMCNVVIDQEAFKNVAIRAKGNTSLTQVKSYGNDRYSFTLEFDHYEEGKSYYGLDKLSLNNIIQDNTYMKDFLTYQMMARFGVNAPLCSYVQIRVNGEPWGLYLAVESVEESFLERNFGSEYGELYKPDSMNMGGGKGNGDRFDMADWQNNQNGEMLEAPEKFEPGEMLQIPEGFVPPDMSEIPGGSAPEGMGENAENFPRENRQRKQDGAPGDMKSMGSSDVSLIYTDESVSSYQNIFDNAKTDVTKADKKRLIAALKDLNKQTNLEETVNVDEVIRYFVVHNFVCNFDSYTGSMIHNYYLYEEDGQLSMIPWDYNLAFGSFMGDQDATSLVNYPIDSPVSSGDLDSRPMISWIFSDEKYTRMYHQLFQEFLEQYGGDNGLCQLIAKTKEMIAPYVESDPTGFCTYEEFEKGVTALEAFCSARLASIEGQLDGTIPSTSEGQSSDTESLIDGSHISISDMGGMNGMGGGPNPGGMNGMKDKGGFPNTEDTGEMDRENERPSR